MTKLSLVHNHPSLLSASRWFFRPSIENDSQLFVIQRAEKIYAGFTLTRRARRDETEVMMLYPITDEYFVTPTRQESRFLPKSRSGPVAGAFPSEVAVAQWLDRSHRVAAVSQWVENPIVGPQRVWNSVGLKGRGKREISEKTGRPAASSGTNPREKGRGLNPVRLGGRRACQPFGHRGLKTTELTGVPVLADGSSGVRQMANSQFSHAEAGGKIKASPHLDMPSRCPAGLLVSAAKELPRTDLDFRFHNHRHWGRDGKEAVMAFVRDPSPTLAWSDFGKPRKADIMMESNPGPPECESSELPLRHLARTRATLILHMADEYTVCMQVDRKQGFQKCSVYHGQPIVKHWDDVEGGRGYRVSSNGPCVWLLRAEKCSLLTGMPAAEYLGYQVLFDEPCSDISLTNVTFLLARAAGVLGISGRFTSVFLRIDCSR
ncbi:hypothetical protein PR048_006579 [Dryococelus australis]|uniref:Uncharacterized protein n=1 Tax=Dryococelus australis TaxID=614101 RepID=A0ABQ9IDL1_9NEOP|nr:hypothetical protein PR048_006579 [Dryococelus australis]